MTAPVLITAAQRRQRLVARHLRAVAARREAQSAALTTSVALVALHSSDPVSVYLSVLARTPDAEVEDVSAALYDDRELVRVHGMRRTLWVADVDTASDIVTASAQRLARGERRRLAGFLADADAGISDAEAWIDNACTDVLDYLADVAPADDKSCAVVDTRTIGEALPHLALTFTVAAGKRYEATLSAHSRILLLLGLEGRIVRALPRGSWIASQYGWADPESWLGRALVGSTDGAATARAQATMVGRYLEAFGPVTTDDVAWWTGWPKGAVVKALHAIEAVEVAVDEGPAWLAAGERPGSATDGGADDGDVELDEHVRVLPALDPTTMGWKDRDWYLDPAMTADLFDRNGNAGPTIWVGGRVVGGWAQRDDGELVYRLLGDVGRSATSEIERQLDSLQTRLGDTRYRVRFPNPLNTELRR